MYFSLLVLKGIYFTTGCFLGFYVFSGGEQANGSLDLPWEVRGLHGTHLDLPRGEYLEASGSIKTMGSQTCPFQPLITMVNVDPILVNRLVC